MKWLNGDRMRFVLVGIMAAMVISGGRAKADFTFGTPVNLGPIVNSESHDDTPFISHDGLSLYSSSFRQGGDQGGGEIWLCTHETTESEWGSPENVGPTINTPAQEFYPSISTDGLEFYFTRWEDVAGDSAILVSILRT